MWWVEARIQRVKESNGKLRESKREEERGRERKREEERARKHRKRKCERKGGKFTGASSLEVKVAHGEQHGRLVSIAVRRLRPQHLQDARWQARGTRERTQAWCR